MDVARTPPCRLDLVFAAKAPLAVILRRGPSRRVRMIAWNTKTDHFIDGEWWHGRIYAEKSGLSPDGQLFVYFGYQWSPRCIPKGVFAFTAVSKPPHFKPVALWPASDFWGGGGSFSTNRKLLLNYGKGSLPEAHPSFRPQGLEVGELPSHCSHPAPDEGFRGASTSLLGADWVGKDHQGRPIFTRAGGLYRTAKGQEVLLRDFNVDAPPPLGRKHPASATELTR
jgi:hypothetical protein